MRRWLAVARAAVGRARGAAGAARNTEPWSAPRRAIAEGLLVVMLASLPVSTAVQEVACALGLALVALDHTARAAVARAPLLAPALVAGIVWTAAPAAGGALREGIGHAWLLAPLVVVPGLVAYAEAADGREGLQRQGESAVARAAGIGLHAAAAAALWGVLQRVGGLADAAHGAFSHHLTLAYALMPALSYAVASRRWAHAGAIAAGIVATGSSGAVLALPVAGIGARVARPRTLLLVATALTIVALVYADADELGQRAVLWTGGLTVAERGPVGPGGYAAASASIYDALRPGFWFPNHAHDASIELLATTGWPGLVAMLGLVFAALRAPSRVGAAGLAAVLVGGWTQDVLGDLEVARAVWTWLALDLAVTRPRDTRFPP
jgi:hypothetical protein